MLSLKHFVLKAEVLQLYRDCLRRIKGTDAISIKEREGVYRLALGLESRDEIRSWIRSEIERNRSVSDINQIRFLLTGGRQSYKEIAHSMEISGSNLYL